ncbi:hypothetical protein [Paracoccus sp. Ld10]|uniref:hypothetical protein n=1 Tax=Paracoccus sp. Ld10 TaxID=649158 RepID=UPI00386EA7F0
MLNFFKTSTLAVSIIFAAASALKAEIVEAGAESPDVGNSDTLDFHRDNLLAHAAEQERLANGPFRLDDPDACTAIVNGEELILRDPSSGAGFDEAVDNTTFREIFFSGWGGQCPSYAILKHITPELNVAERAAFCLSYDEETEQYLGYEVGARDAYGVCRQPSRTLCERVNAGKEVVLAVSGVGAGASAGTSGAMAAAGVTAVTHSSGAVILTGSSGYIAGTLGTAATTALGILSAPAVIAGSAVALVAAGGAVYVCKE